MVTFKYDFNVVLFDDTFLKMPPRALQKLKIHVCQFEFEWGVYALSASKAIFSECVKSVSRVIPDF